MKKNVLALVKVGAIGVAGVIMQAAHAAGGTAPDFTTLTSAVDFSTVATAILAVAATTIGVLVTWKGVQFIMKAVKG